MVFMDSRRLTGKFLFAKSLLSRFATCDSVTKVFSRFIVIRSPRHPRVAIALPRNSVSPQTAPAVFFGFYEAAELRAINHLLPSGLPVVEIGGGVGVVSSHVIQKLSSGPLRVVEANPRLINILEYNLASNNVNKIPFEIVHGALDYSGHEMVGLEISASHLETRVKLQNEFLTGSDFAPALTLADVVNGWNDYSLIADIEGAEVEFILGDEPALDRCMWLCLELHRTSFQGQPVSISELLEGIANKGFELTYMDGPVVVARRK